MNRKEFLILCDRFDNMKDAYYSIPIPGIDTRRDGVNRADIEYRPISKLPKNPVTTMAYVPFQTDITEYDSEKALMNGTAFPDLDKPFYGKAGCRR